MLDMTTRPLKTQIIRSDSAVAGINVVWISELGQKTGSFKYRAAWNLVDNVDAPHFLAASSGNFGAALALAAREANRGCTIVMPNTSAKVKIEAVRGYGATVDLIDVNHISRAQRVADLADKNPHWHVASAYDCDHVIAGNATLGAEIADLDLHLDQLIVPVGGGGLSSGILLGFLQHPLTVEIWGAEPEMANDAIRSLSAGRLIQNETEPQTLADGARTVSLGKRNWRIIHKHISGVYAVSEANIIEAMRVLASNGLRVEPTGALSTGAVLEHRALLQGQVVGCVISGGNVDSSLYDDLVNPLN